MRTRRGPLLSVLFSAVFMFAAGAAGTQPGNPSAKRVSGPLETDVLQAADYRVLSSPRKGTNFTYEKGLQGEHTYIVQLADAPVATYRGDVRGYAATSVGGDRKGNRARANTNARGRLDARSAASRAYAGYLDSRQSEFRDRLQQTLRRNVERKYSYKYAFNGVAVRMTQDEAARAASLPGVVRVERDRADMPDTSQSVAWIGAPSIWDGNATGIAAQGEGMLVGILDTGIDPGNPQFAEVGGDGYVHTNPLGDGVFLGECNEFSGLCNNKLIGCYAFLEANEGDELQQPGDPLCRDTDGHGSHVAGTAAGNIYDGATVHNLFGDDSGLSFGTVSGVAPHANIIAYKVCAPSCFTSDRVAAVDQALLDGVDAINHSIGSAGGNPWDSAMALAFLNARDAGVSVANSAGNSGPGAGSASSSGNAPWVTSVAASTHDREIPDKMLMDMSGGDTTPPADMTGKALTPGYGPASIVYAGDYSNGDPNPDQCLTAFPADTWTAGEIVVCDRGAIARVSKCANVAAGGAAGCVLANLSGGATSVVADPHLIPSIHIDSEQGDVLKAWLASGTGHMATIGASPDAVSNPAAADHLAGFSSRGPYNDFDILAPNVAAPGVSVFAPGANLQFRHPGHDDPDYPGGAPSVDGRWGVISGTSMASPHAAGSSLLLQQVHPEWTAAEVLSAMMTTGETAMLKEDGATAADPFDYGGGRISLVDAARAGLVLDETTANFEAANPDLGGDPKTLNVAAIFDDQCLVQCSFSRTVRATVNGSWSVSAAGSAMVIDAVPSSFSLLAGETQTIDINVDVEGLPVGQFIFDQIDITPVTRGFTTPPTHLSVAIQPSTGVFPVTLDFETQRDADSRLVTGLQALESPNIQIEPLGLTRGDTQIIAVTGETGAFSPYDQPAGVGVGFFDVPPGAVRTIVRTFNSEAPDADLFVGRDDNGDGMISVDEERCRAGTGGSDESCQVADPEAGTWWVAVINFAASDPDATDETSVQTASVTGNEGNMSIDGPTGFVAALDPFDIRVLWDLQDAAIGDVYYGNIRLGTDAGREGDIGLIDVSVTRIADDVSFLVTPASAGVTDILTYTAIVSPNITLEERIYNIQSMIPAGFSYVPGSLSASHGTASESGGNINWDVTQPVSIGLPLLYEVTDNGADPDNCRMPNFGQGSGYIDLEGFNIFPGTLEGDTVTASGFSTQDPMTFYDGSYAGVSFTDDGFAYFAGGLGGSPWVNQSLPDPAAPNNLIALFWRDMEIVRDVTPGSVRGVSTATAGSNRSFIEYDDIEPFPAGDTSSRMDMEVLIYSALDPEPGAYEIVVAYDNVVGFDDNIGTIGVEDDLGARGTEYAFDSITPANGLLVCFDLNSPAETMTLTWQVMVEFDANGTDVVTELTDTVSTPGTELVTHEVTVAIDAAIDTDEDGLFDYEDNCTEKQNPSQCDSDGDGFGNHCDADFNDSGFVTFADMAELKVGFFGTSEAPDYSELDLNCDGEIEFQDLTMFKMMFFGAPGPSGTN